MPDLNQIIQGDSIAVLNDGPEGWVDLCFADPPFNIGYLYHGYDDERDDHVAHVRPPQLGRRFRRRANVARRVAV